jgi:hypothetical protein
MKKLMILAVGMMFLVGAKAQDLSVSVDLYNRYVWRGVEYGTGPSIQPTIEFSKGVFSIGAWGAYSTGSATSENYYAEADLYTSISLENGLSFGLTDYYYPGTSWFDLSNDSLSSHILELNLGYEIGKFSIAGNYIINESSSSEGGDMYFELGYTSGAFNAFVGGGDGWHTSNGNFQICNVGVGTAKDIKVTDTFTIPVSGSVIVNPNTEQLFLVVGVSF